MIWVIFYDILNNLNYIYENNDGHNPNKDVKY